VDNAAVLSALRSRLLASPKITDLVGQKVYVSRADVAGQTPAVALEIAGGEGRLNRKHHRVDVRVNIWSAVSWAQAFEIQDNVSNELDFTPSDRFPEFPEPLLTVTASAPIQMPQGDYYHLVQTFTVTAKEA